MSASCTLPSKHARSASPGASRQPDGGKTPAFGGERSQALSGASPEILLEEVKRLEFALSYERRLKARMQEMFRAELKTQQEAHRRDITELEQMLEQLRARNERISAQLAEEVAAKEAQADHPGCPRTLSGSTEGSWNDSEGACSGSAVVYGEEALQHELLSEPSEVALLDAQEGSSEGAGGGAGGSPPRPQESAAAPDQQRPHGPQQLQQQQQQPQQPRPRPAGADGVPCVPRLDCGHHHRTSSDDFERSYAIKVGGATRLSCDDSFERVQ